MKKTLIPVVLCTILLFSCAEEKAKINKESKKIVETIEAEKKVEKKIDSPYATEIGMIKAAVEKINTDASLVQSTRADDKLPCEIKEWKDSDGTVLKFTKSCGDNSISQVHWAFYYHKYDATTRKVLFVKYVKEEYNAPITYTKEQAAAEGVTEGYYDPSKTKVTTRLVYSIGTLMEGKETFGLVLDETGKQIKDLADENGYTDFDYLMQEVTQ